MTSTVIYIKACLHQWELIIRSLKVTSHYTNIFMKYEINQDMKCIQNNWLKGIHKMSPTNELSVRF